MPLKCRIWALTFLLFILAVATYCHEKTLRKIVRKHSKMVQKPFSGSYNDNGDIFLRNTSIALQTNEGILSSGFTQVKTVMHKLHRPKISTILSSIDVGKEKINSRGNSKSEYINPFELRLPSNSFKNLTMFLQESNRNNYLFPSPVNQNVSYQEDTRAGKLSASAAAFSNFFPPIDEHELESIQPNIGKENISNEIVIPITYGRNKEGNIAILKSTFVTDTETRYKQAMNSLRYNSDLSTEKDDKADYLIEEVGNLKSDFMSEAAVKPYICTEINRCRTDIDAQSMFAGLEIEPAWMAKRQYWDTLFDSRYESLMRNIDWPPLSVILMPFSQVDSIWKRTFENDFNSTVSKILSNMVKKLQFYKNMTFTWNEVSHLSHWWKTASQKRRLAFRKLLKSGRLEITTGGWVETDEATASLFGLVHQLIEGHQWLKQQLNYSPKVGWSTNSVTHSPTYAYLLSLCGIKNFVINNLHYSWEEYLAEFQYSDFIWIQDWDNDINTQTSLNHALEKIGGDRYPKHSVLAHFLQFNVDNLKACGPNQEVCELYDFSNSAHNNDIHTYNIKQKSEMLLEQYSKTGSITHHNVIIAPIGGRYRYETQTEFDYQYNNYQRLVDFININSDIYKASIDFGTPNDYFNLILKRNKRYPTLKGDFNNFADIRTGTPAYWTGFFTSRPVLKLLLRRLQSSFRSAEILLAFAVNLNTNINMSSFFDILIKSRETVARLQDRHVIGGTLNSITTQLVFKKIMATAKDCWHLQEVASSLLLSKSNSSSPFLQKIVYREGEIMSSFKSINPGDQIYIFNSLSTERTETVELITKQSNVRILDYHKKEVTIQINPIWAYNANNMIKISRQFFKIIFIIVIPPLTLELYKIKETYDATNHAATVYCTDCIIPEEDYQKSTFPFTIQPIQQGDVQLESYKYRIILDELTGFLKTVIDKDTNEEKTVLVDYGAFRSSDINAGMFLFNTNVTKPLYDILMPFRVGIKTKSTMIVSGLLTSEITTVYGRLLQHTVKIFSILSSPLAKCIHIETKTDLGNSPKNREVELFLSIKTDINNGKDPAIHIDNNGFQYTPHILNISRRIESNVYPITRMVYIQDDRNRMTLITDHTQAVTALQEGHLIVVLDRRVLYDDGRGTGEGLADSSSSVHRHYLLLENFANPANQHGLTSSKLELPSFSALYLANGIDNRLDLFMVTLNSVPRSYHAFMPLTKALLPCDISLVTFRIMLNTKSYQLYSPTSALMVLHRQGFTCHIESLLKLCDGESNFSLKKIFKNVRAVLHTNLVGNDDGVPIEVITRDNMAVMELMTIKIFFEPI